MSLGNAVLNLMYGNPLAPLGGGPAALPQNRQGGPPAAAGASSGGSGAPVPSPVPGASQTPSPATQSPPDLANLYLQLAQRQQAANLFDRGLNTIAAANSTPSMQRALMGGGGGGGGGGTGMDIKSLMELQMMQRYANMPAPGSGGGAAVASGLVPQQSGGAAPAASGPSIDKDTWDRMDPFARQKWVEQSAQAQIAAQTKAGELRQTNLIEAQQGYPAAMQKAEQVSGSLNWLSDPANKDAVVSALQHPEATDASTWGGTANQYNPFGPNNNAFTARAKINQLINEMGTEALKNSGQSRMAVQEFLKVSSAMSNLNGLRDPDAIKEELDRLTNVNKSMRANLQAQAGRPLDSGLTPYADPNYFNPNRPEYTGATAYKGETPGSALSEKTAAGGGGAPSEAVAYLKAHPELAPQFDAKYGAGASKALMGQ